jgi:peptidyl-tRNA hydrolase
MTHPDTLLFVIVRKDLEFSTQSLVQNTSTAIVNCINQALVPTTYNVFIRKRMEWFSDWSVQGRRIVTLGCDNLSALVSCRNSVINHNQDIPHYTVKQTGYTSAEPETVTCLGIGACPREEVVRFVMQFQLL